MRGYRDSGNIGSGKSLRYFLSSTAARCGSPNVASETTFPRSYASLAARRRLIEGDLRKRPSSSIPEYEHQRANLSFPKPCLLGE